MYPAGSQVKVALKYAKNLYDTETFGKMDPYVQVRVLVSSCFQAIIGCSGLKRSKIQNIEWGWPRAALESGCSSRLPAGRGNRVYCVR